MIFFFFFENVRFSVWCTKKKFGIRSHKGQFGNKDRNTKMNSRRFIVFCPIVTHCVWWFTDTCGYVFRCSLWFDCRLPSRPTLFPRSRTRILYLLVISWTAAMPSSPWRERNTTSSRRSVAASTRPWHSCTSCTIKAKMRLSTPVTTVKDRWKPGGIVKSVM